MNVVVNCMTYDLRTKDIPKGNKATSTTRSHQSVSQNVSYVNMFQESSSKDTASEATVKPLGAAIKREPSHYRLVAHIYMLASRRGIITRPKVRTRASTVPKQESLKPPCQIKGKLLDVTKNQRIKPSRKCLLQKPTS